MNQQDPILNVIGVVINRIILFLLLGASFGTGLWLTMLIVGYQATFSELWSISKSLLQGRQPFIATAVFYGCYTLGFLVVAVMFLLAALWWRGRGDTLHRRGPQIIDGRFA